MQDAGGFQKFRPAQIPIWDGEAEVQPCRVSEMPSRELLVIPGLGMMYDVGSTIIRN